jgi:hypothetical protein
VKRTREVNKELKAQLKEYKKQLSMVPKVPHEPPKISEQPVLPPKPTLEQCGWDEETFSTKLFEWKGKEQEVLNHAAEVKKAQEEQEATYRQKLEKYREEATKLNAVDFTAAEG